MSGKDLGAVEILGADAVGQPGQRRFRLFTRTKTSSAILWVEKEQMTNLSLVIDRILAQATEGRILRTEARAGGLTRSGEEMPDNFPFTPDYDFQVGQLRVTFEGAQERFILAAVPFDLAEDRSGNPQLYLNSDEELAFQFSIVQAQQLTLRITALVSSGRPVCPFCHAPLDGSPHACIKQNGHHQLIQELESDQEE